MSTDAGGVIYSTTDEDGARASFEDVGVGVLLSVVGEDVWIDARALRDALTRHLAPESVPRFQAFYEGDATVLRDLETGRDYGFALREPLEPFGAEIAPEVAQDPDHYIARDEPAVPEGDVVTVAPHLTYTPKDNA